MTSLDLSKNNMIFEINCSDNQLNEIIITDCPDIGILHCNNNKLKDINLSDIEYLTELKAKDNPTLKNIYVKKGFKTSEVQVFEIPDYSIIIEQNKTK